MDPHPSPAALPAWPDAALYQRIIDESPDAIAVLDRRYCFVAFNRRYLDEFEGAFGLRLKPGMTLETALAGRPREYAVVFDRWTRALNGEEFTIISEIKDASGLVRPYEVDYYCVRSPEGGVRCAFLRARDTADAVALAAARAQLERERRDEYLRLAESAANIGLWHWDARSGRVTGSLEWRRLYGIPTERHDASLTDLLATIDAEDLERLLRIAHDAAACGENTFAAEFRVMVNNDTRWLMTQGRLDRNADGFLDGVFGVTIDLTERKRSEQELAEVKQRLEAHLENSPIAVVEFAPDFRVVRFSKEAERLFGWQASDLTGKHPLVLPWVHEDDLPAIRQVLEEMARGQRRKASGVSRNYRKDGRIVYCEWFTSALLGPDGKLSSVLSFAIDVTARHYAEAALRDSERKFRATFELAGVGMTRVGLDGRMLQVNHKLCQILGYTQEELLAMTFMDLTHPDDLNSNLRLYEQALSGEIENYSLEKRYLRKNGTSVWIRLTAALVRAADGSPAFFISVVEDITSRKTAQAALQRSNDDLKNFAYAAAHDLQEPLRMISTHTQLLSRRLGPSLNLDDQKLMGYVVDGAARLQELLRGLREYLEIAEQDSPPDAQADLNAAFEQARRNLDAAVLETGAVIEADNLPMARGFALHFVQLFQNLLSNAIKYTRPGTRPVVRVGCREAGGEWVVSITDNGIGIAPAYHERIFGVFKRLHGREVPGTGIGLAICAKIVERYGGRIWVESVPGDGSCFCFTLPRSA
jgi:PAS domain S-box-containing protein